jgi:hypothetical protein
MLAREKTTEKIEWSRRAEGQPPTGFENLAEFAG